MPGLVHPLHAFLLGWPVPLFLGALLTDWAYAESAQIQWSNFSSWLIAAALLATLPALIWALARLIRPPPAERRRRLLHLLALVLLCVVGLVNAFVHGKDAWAVMPEGLYLSLACVLLVLLAAGLGLGPRAAPTLRPGLAR